MEWMQLYVQRQVKRLKFNEFSKAVLSANDLHKSGECLDMNVLFRFQSHSISKRRDQTPKSAFALIPPQVSSLLSVQLDVCPLTYLHAHFIMRICHYS